METSSLINDIISKPAFQKIISKHKNNWNRISSELELPEKFIEKYQDKVNWTRISSCNKCISEHFILKFYEKINWSCFASHRKISNNVITFILKYLEKNKIQYDKFFSTILQTQNLSESIIIDHINEINQSIQWADIVLNSNVSIKFIEKYKNNIPWDFIAKCYYLDKKFIKKYKHYLNFKYLKKYQEEINFKNI